MFSKSMIALLLVLLPAFATAQEAKAVIDAASKAMGADTLKTLEYSGSGSDFVFGQNYSPTTPWPRFTVKSYTRQLDFEANAAKTDRVRLQAENPPRGGGQQPVRGEQPQNQTVIIGSNTPWVQQLDVWMTPYGFLKAAAANNATVKSQRVNGKQYRVLSFTGQNKAAVNGYVNDQNLVERVETWIDNPLYGDTVLEAIYSDYKDVNGVKFPMKIVQRQGQYPILDLTITDVKPNAPVSIQPQGRAGGPPAAAAGAAQASTTPSEKLGDGVFLILGGYASLALDFKDYIVVVESGQSDERATAVIAEAKRLIPGKPIKYIVNTHHHVDHSSGMRAFIAEGATIVTHKVNKDFFERIASAPKTLNPDAQAAAKKKPAFELVSDKKVMTSGDQVIEIYSMGSGHNEGLLMVYLPKQKVLLQADAYNPGPANAPIPTPVSPYTANLASNIERLKLDVERIIPVHYPADNRQVTRAELMRMVGQGTN
jgi:glyoxylase-like metal-dependent hydrolase (beta-lactamase superfamily II)